MLLLDEPLGALDLKLRKGLQVELKRIQREVGITFVYVTHDQEEALTMSDRIAVMNRGRVEQIGDAGGRLRAPGDHLRRRLHRRLQPDAGDMVAGAGEVRLEHGPAVQVPARRPVRRASAATRWCGRRSCGSTRSTRRAPPPRTGMPPVEGVVESSLYLGTATQIVVDLGGDVRMTVLVPNASEAERQRLPGGGARVALSWEPEHMHLVRIESLQTEQRRVSRDAKVEEAVRSESVGALPCRRGDRRLALGLAACGDDTVGGGSAKAR